MADAFHQAGLLPLRCTKRMRSKMRKAIRTPLLASDTMMDEEEAFGVIFLLYGL